MQEFVWSDNWYIEDHMAWFVDGELNLLFCYDLDKEEANFIAEIPDINPGRFRLNPRCIKNGNEIYCMPDMGSSIWIYDLEQGFFQEIQVKNLDNVRLCICRFWKYNGKIFALSCGLKEIIEINLEKKEIDNYYKICVEPELTIIDGIMVDTGVYCIAAPYNYIYQFDLDKKKTVVHKLKGIEDCLNTITYDGNKFWLSGYRKKLYIWDKKDDFLEIIEKFPLEFGIYDFTNNGEFLLDCETEKYEVSVFLQSIVLKEYVWFIPFRTNKILYVNTYTNQIHTLDIKEEEETRESLLKNIMLHKFLLQYVRDNRYIGLFSFKNMSILEIDTLKKTVERKNYLVGKEYLHKISFCKNALFFEGNYCDKIYFKRLMTMHDEDRKRKKEEIICIEKGKKAANVIEKNGNKIYEETRNSVLR